MGSHPFTPRSAGLLALTTTAAAVTLTLAGSQAAAAPPLADPAGGVSVLPASPAPGTDIALRITGCAEHVAVAASDALVADALLAGADGTLAGDSRVQSSARPGKYDVRVMCGAGVMVFKGALKVAAAASPGVSVAPAATFVADKSPAASAPAASGSASTASPVAPVRAGGGGTAGLVAVDAVTAVDEADGSRSSGPGTARSVTGLVLAGAAAVAVALRCTRRRREAD